MSMGCNCAASTAYHGVGERGVMRIASSNSPSNLLITTRALSQPEYHDQLWSAWSRQQYRQRPVLLAPRNHVARLKKFSAAFERTSWGMVTVLRAYQNNPPLRDGVLIATIRRPEGQANIRGGKVPSVQIPSNKMAENINLACHVDDRVYSKQLRKPD